MLPDLDTWQARLAFHFEELAVKRGSAPGKPPVFALEHGLDESEIVSVSEAVCKHIESRSPSMDHRLPWIVYATELGYRYSGNEYWQTFEAKTPGWAGYNKRSWIRKCFKWFQREYRGATPTGEWAKHFTIICWPITNAVLPKDLQRQLAHVLYKIRHSYSQEMFEGPLLLGQLIAENSWNESSRFQNFVQETELVGQIAAALLLEGDPVTKDLLSRSTLQRLSQDLNRERQRREWLRVARYSAKERTRVRGLIRGTGSIDRRSTKEEVRSEIELLGIEPRLVLKPINVERTSWNVSIEIPDLSNLDQRFPDTQHILKHSRCHIVGGEDSPIARGRFMYGSQRLTLNRWPNADEVLLQFEERDPHLEFLLKTECMLRPGPPWLFRIASDRLAYECRGLRVRPGQRYIILTPYSTQVSASADVVQSVDIQCQGIQGTRLNLPAKLSPHLEEVIQYLGLMPSRLIKIWPAGLAPVHWDGEGYSEWLEGERPIFAIQSDHPLGMIRMRFDSPNSPTIELARVTPGEPVFFELPRLPAGLYTIHADAITAETESAENLGHLKVRVAKNQRWPHGLGPSSPLSVRINPVEPPLEELWDGQVDLEVLGPHDRVVQCSISLMNREEEKPAIQISTSMELPITSSQWKIHFEKCFRTKRNVLKKYDAAYACQIDFTAGELGAFSIRCERITPLRWALIDGHSLKPVIRLIGDRGREEVPQVFHYTFEKPADKENLGSAKEYEVVAPGGLYLARQGEFSAGIIVSLRKINSFNSLPHSPIISHQRRSLDTVLKAIKLSCEWASARSSRDIFSARNRHESLRVFTQYIAGLIAGARWERAESEYKENHDLHALMGAIIKQKDKHRFASSLKSEAAEISQESVGRRVSRLAKLAVRYDVLREIQSSTTDRRNPKWITEFALRLGSSPRDASDWAGSDSDLRTGVNRLMEESTILRAARFLILATHNFGDSDVNPGEVYTGWEWT